MSEAKVAEGVGSETVARLQQELESLREEMARRDDFLALAAHELRNPMHALSLQIVAARVSAQSAGASEVVGQLVRTQATLNRYVARATALLDLIRLGAQSYPVAPQPVDLCKLLSQIAEGQRPESRYHGTTLELQLPEQCLARTDPVALEHIVGNLLSNAFKHSCGDRVTLSLRPLPQQRQVLIVVADNGRGIADADRDRVFGKFQRADGAGTAGSGLGLWLSRQLAQSLSGELQLDRQHRPGAAFMLRLPLIPEPHNR